MSQTYSWRAITEHAALLANDGTEVGKVIEVAALPNEDIFHGVVFRSHMFGHLKLAPAEDIGDIEETKVHLLVSAEQANAYGEFHQEDMETAGLKGRFFWKHAGWSKSSE